MTRPGACVVVGFSAVIAACASASVGGNGDDAIADARVSIDAPSDGRVAIDAPAIDAAAPIPVSLTQTTSAAIGSASSAACGNVDGTTAENSWYRVYRLADANITNGLRVTAVTFGVQQAVGSPAVQVKIGTYSGNVTPPPAQLDTGLITPIMAVTFNVPNTTASAAMSVTVPITANVPALSQMIVEVFAPNLVGTSKYFYLGGNSSGESKPGYLRAPSCATPQPKTTAAVGFPMSHLVISVSGTH